MDYEAMWYELKSKVERDLRFYRGGFAQSIEERLENLSKEMQCERVLTNMKILEEKYRATT